MMKKIQTVLAAILLVAAQAACQPPVSTPAPDGGLLPTAAENTQAPLATTGSALMPTPTVTTEPHRAALIELVNSVDAHAWPAEDWQAARLDMRLYSGGEVWSKEAATALLELLEGDRLRVAPNTIFTFDQPDEQTLQIDMNQGQIWVDIQGLEPGQKFEVETPAVLASVRGTQFTVRVDADGTTVVAVVTGTVTVTGTLNSQVVIAPNSVSAAPGGSLSDPQPASPEMQVSWGWAAGQGLTVLAPVAELISSFNLDGPTYDGIFTGDSRVLILSHGIPQGDQSYLMETLFYDIPAAGMFVPPALTNSVYGVSPNPVGPGMAWVEGTTAGPQVCTITDTDWAARQCFGEPGINVRTPGWSPEGQWLVFVRNDPNQNEAWNLVRARTDGTDLSPLTDIVTGTIANARVSPDGAFVSYLHMESSSWDSPGSLWVVRSDGSDPRLLAEGVTFDNTKGGFWSPDSAWLAYADSQGLNFFNVISQTAQLVAGTLPGYYSALKWSPTLDGFPLVYTYIDLAGEKGKNFGEYYLPGLGAEPVLGSLPGSWGPVWSPDGSLVAYGFNTASDPAGSQPKTSTVLIFRGLPGSFP